MSTKNIYGTHGGEVNYGTMGISQPDSYKNTQLLPFRMQSEIY